MGKGGSNAEISIGTEAWNVADGYTKLKILKHLVFMDRYELVALYGSEEMDVEPFDQTEMSKRRLNGINRMASALRLILGNVKFAVEKPEHRKAIGLCMERWENVDGKLGELSFYTTNHVNHTRVLSINEELFMFCLDILRSIKDDLNIPLNKSGLIFRENEEVDLDKIENDIVFGG